MFDIKDIINEPKIFDILEKTKKPTAKKVAAILRKAGKKKGLSLEDIGWLVNTHDQKLIEQMFKVAGNIKKKFTASGLYFRSPLYFQLLRKRLRLLRISY